MAKVILDPLDPDAIPRTPGLFYHRSTRWGELVCKWPQKGKRKVTWQERWWREQFGYAGRMASNPLDLDYETARFLSEPLVNPPRDLLTQAIYGKLYIITAPDGFQWPVNPHHPPPEGPPQPIPQEEDMWEWAMANPLTGQTQDGNAMATKGIKIDIRAPFSIKAVRAFISTIHGGETYRCTIGIMNNAFIIQSIDTFADVVAEAQTHGVLQWDIQHTFTQGEHRFISISRIDAANTDPILMYRGNYNWLFPLGNSVFFRLPFAVPAVGQQGSSPFSASASIGFNVVP